MTSLAKLGRPPLHNREAMRKMRAKGMTVIAIADRYGVAKSAVHRAVADIGIDGRIMRANVPPPWLPRAVRLLRAGMSRNAAAAKLGVPKSNLYRALAKFG